MDDATAIRHPIATRPATATRQDPDDGGAPAEVLLAVVGAHLSGQPLNGQLTERGARLVRTTTTSAQYRLHALDTVPPKPGLVRVDDGGVPIELEVWSLDDAGFGSFVAAVPSPLCIGKVTLADHQEVSGFLCEPHALVHAPDIRDSGGWRAHLAAGGRAVSP